MNLAKQLGSRFKAEFIGQFIAMGASALLTVLLARLLSPSDYGLLFLAIAVFSIVKVFSTLGIPQSTARYITDYNENNPQQIPHILKKSTTYMLTIVIFVSILFLFLRDTISIWIDEPKISSLLGIGTLYIAFSSLTAYVRSVSQGFEDIKLASSINIIKRVTQLIVALGLVLLGFSVLGALLGFIIGFLLAFIFGAIAIYSKHYKVETAAENIEPGLARRIIEYSVPLSITSMTLKLDEQVDTVLVGFFLNPIAVSYYVLSKQIVTFIQMPASALGFSVSPTFGKQKAKDQLSTTAKIFEDSFTHLLLLYIPGSVGIILIAPSTIELAFGSDYMGAVPVLQVLSLHAILQAVTQLTDHPLDYLGEARKRAIAKSIASVGNLALNILLIPFIGVVGAAIATVITHTFYVAVKLYIIYDELPLDVFKIVKGVIKITIITAGMALTVWLLTPYITSFFTLLLIITVGVITWGGLSLICGAINYKIISSII